MDPKLYYLNHSGFLLELETVILVFDFFTDPAERLAHYTASDKPVVFFVSHDHYDHWNPDILDFSNQVATYYVMDRSCDTEELRAAMHQDEREVWFVEPGAVLDETEIVPELQRIYVFDSTDAGSSFLVLTTSGSVFHAGDLNDWDWQDEESEAVEQAYRHELNALAVTWTTVQERHSLTEAGRLLLACLPVDQRLEEKALRGAEIFLDYLQPLYLAPMHLNGGEKLPRALAATLSRQGRGSVTEVLELTVPGQSVTLNESRK